MFSHQINRETIAKAIILAFATPIILSSPAGTRILARQLDRELTKRINRHREDQLSPTRVRQSLYKIKRKRYYRQINEKSGVVRFELTKKGEQLLRECQFFEVQPRKASKWDGQWHFVSFDVPQRARYARDIFRDKLKRMGFFQVQQSLWVHPYDCKQEIDFITDFLHIESYVLEFRTAVEKDEKMRAYFQKKGFAV